MRFWLIVVIVLFIGCGEDGFRNADEPPVDIDRVTPPGGEIAANETITVIFTESPFCVSVSHGAVRVSGKIVTIVGPFPQGPLTLTMTWWWDGIRTLNYTVVDKMDEQ